MLEHAGLYFVGFLFGETALFGWWAKSQPAGSGLASYWAGQQGQVVLSSSVALAMCLLWAEGSLVAYLPGNPALTRGLSVLSGFTLTFFSHLVLKTLAKRYGLSADDKE